MMTSGTAATTVAAVQIRAVPCDVAGNLDKALGFLEEASSRGARLTLFPELFNTGYFIGPELFDLAETDEGRTVTWMREQAARHDMLVAGSIPERRGDRLLNTLFIVEPDGRLHRYAKRQPFKTELAAFDFGDDESIVDTSLGRAGCAICADLDWGRTLMRPLAGNVDLLIFSRASPLPKLLARGICHLERNRPFLARTAGAIGAPMLLAGLVGPTQRIWRLPGAYVFGPSYLYGGTWITDARGHPLTNVPFGKEGLAVADIRIGSAGGDPNAAVFRNPGFGFELLSAFVVVDTPANLRPPRAL